MAWFHLVFPATSHLVSDKLCFRHLVCVNSRLHSATYALFHKRPCRSPRCLEAKSLRLSKWGRMYLFVGTTGNTGKRIFEKLVAKGFVVIAGVRDVDKAKSTFSNNPSRQIVKDGITEDVDQLAVGDDSDAFFCATGFKS